MPYAVGDNSLDGFLYVVSQLLAMIPGDHELYCTIVAFVIVVLEKK
jgi:hypothetical protein